MDRSAPVRETCSSLMAGRWISEAQLTLTGRRSKALESKPQKGTETTETQRGQTPISCTSEIGVCPLCVSVVLLLWGLAFMSSLETRRFNVTTYSRIALVA